MTRYSKALVALIPGIIAALKVLSDALGDGVVSTQEGIALAIALLTAAAVYSVDNTTTDPHVAATQSVHLKTDGVGGR